MKEKQIRKWIVGWFVVFGVIMLLSMSGAVWAALKHIGGDSIENIQRTLQYANAGMSVALSICLIGLGWTLYSLTDKLARWGGGALAVTGLIQVLNQCVAVYLFASSIEKMPLWAIVTFSIVGTLTACAAVLIIAKYYTHGKMYKWALAFSVGQIGVAISTVWMNVNHDAKIMTLNLGLCSLIVTVSQIVYMVLWYKHLKTAQNEPM